MSKIDMPKVDVPKVDIPKVDIPVDVAKQTVVAIATMLVIAVRSLNAVPLRGFD